MSQSSAQENSFGHAIAPPKGRLTGGILSLFVGHALWFSLIPALRNEWGAMALGLTQMIYVWPLAYLFKRLHWSRTRFGLWLGVLFTLVVVSGGAAFRWWITGKSGSGI